MRNLVAIVGVFVIAAIVACGYDPHPISGKLPCTSHCPNGYVCTNNFCYLTGTGPDGGPSAGTAGGAGATGTGGTAGMDAGDASHSDALAPAISNFTASPESILTNQSSTLSWSVTGATSLSIDQGIGSVLSRNSQQVTPTETTTYTLTLNDSVSASVTVTVLNGTFTVTGKMVTPRDSHTAISLQDGTVLIVGGEAFNQPIASAEIYDPNTGTFAATGNMTVERQYHTMTLLPG